MDDFDPGTVAWVHTAGDLDHYLAAIGRAHEVVWDLETTGLVEFAWRGGPQNRGVAGRVVLSAMTLPTEGDGGRPSTWVLPLSHPDSSWLGQWVRVLRRVTRAVHEAQMPIVNQNVKFDARWLHRHTGVDVSALIDWDTMVSSHLLDENASTKLKERAPATFGVRRWDDFDLSTPAAAERVPLIDLGLYAARDTWWTWRLACAHRARMFVGPHDAEPDSPEEIEDARLGRLALWCAMPCVATMTAIEQRGMKLDRAWTGAQLAAEQATAATVRAGLADRYGPIGDGEGDPADVSFAPTATWFGQWAEKAVAAGELRIAEMTATGRPRWSKAVLLRQARAGSEVAEKLLALRDATKRAEFLASWLNWTDRDDVIHAVYNVGRVVTGRLSSDSPNMQQVTSSLKPAFIPRPGHVLIDLDYGQIELRVAAFVSRCAPMLEALRRGDDLHRLLAARITGKDPADVLPSERHGGKSANFGLLYGMSAAGFREYAETVYGVSYTDEEAVAVRSAFFEMWDGIADWHVQQVTRAHRTGQVVSPIGRVRRLPDIHDGFDAMVAHAERNAINSPVQGFASDLMQMAAASIEGRLPGTTPVRDVWLVGTVHDNIVAEAPEDRWETATRDCQERMVTIGEQLKRLDCDLDVPLVANATIGTRWGLDDVGRIE